MESISFFVTRLERREKPDIPVHAESFARKQVVPFYNFGMSRSGIEPTTSRSRGEGSTTMLPGMVHVSM